MLKHFQRVQQPQIRPNPKTVWNFPLSLKFSKGQPQVRLYIDRCYTYIRSCIVLYAHSGESDWWKLRSVAGFEAVAHRSLSTNVDKAQQTRPKPPKSPGAATLLQLAATWDLCSLSMGHHHFWVCVSPKPDNAMTKRQFLPTIIVDNALHFPT